MKRKLFLTLVLSLTSFFACKAQSYILKMMNDDLECVLDVFDNDTYLIKLSYRGGSDLVISQLLSFGECRLSENGCFELSDRLNGFSITLFPLSGNNVLLVKNGFSWMQLNYFVRNSDLTSTNSGDLNNLLTHKQLINFREINNRIEKEDINIGIKGLFQSGFNPAHILNIRENGTFNIKLFSLELSNGSWTKENKLLKLKDKNIETPFYLLINKDGNLRSMLIPGDFLLTTFLRSNNQSSNSK